MRSPSHRTARSRSAPTNRRLLRWSLDAVPDTLTLRHIETPDSRPRPIRCLALTRDFVVVGDDAGTVRRFDVTGFGGSVLLGRHRVNEKVRALAVGGDGGWVTSIADDGELVCWAMDGSGPVTRLVPAALPRTVTTGTDRVLIGDRNGGLTLLDVVPGIGPAARSSGVTAAPAGASRFPAPPEGVQPAPIGTGGLTIVVDQLWTYNHPRKSEFDFDTMRTHLSGGQPCAAVITCPVLPGLQGLRRALHRLGWIVVDVTQDRNGQVRGILEVVEDALRHGRVMLVTGAAEVHEALRGAPDGLTIVDDLTDYLETVRRERPPRGTPAPPPAPRIPMSTHPDSPARPPIPWPSRPAVVVEPVAPTSPERLVVAEALLVRAFAELPNATPTASALKAKMRQLDPGFREQELGFARFRDLLVALPHRVRIAGQSGMDITLALVEAPDPETEDPDPITESPDPVDQAPHPVVEAPDSAAAGADGPVGES